jgi:TP901 family phage tail tape measure protein
MAKNLGIKVEIDLSQPNAQLEYFEKKWKGLGDDKLKLKVDVDTKGITRLANNIDKIFGADSQRDLKLNLDVADALKNLHKFKEEFSKVKKDFEGMGFKTKQPSFGLSDIKNDGKIYGFGSFDKIAQQFGELSSQSKDISVNLTRGMDGAFRTVTNITSKIDDAKTATLKMVDGVTTNIGMSNKESSNIKDYLNMYKEYISLRQKAIKSDGDSKTIDTQINKLKSAMKEFKAEYKNAFNKDIERLDVFKTLKEQSDFKLKLSIEEKGKKDLNNLLKDLKDLYGKKVKLEFEIDNASINRKGLLKNQLKDVESQITGLYNRADNPIPVRQSMDNFIKELRYQEAIKNSVADEKKVISSLVSSQRELLKIKKQIAELDTYKETGSIKPKEEFRLKALKEELRIKQNIYNAEMQQNSKKLSSAGRKQLSEAEAVNKNAIAMAKSQAKVNSEIRESEELYSRLSSSLKEIVSLYKNYSRAGNEQALEIRKQIQAQQQYHDELRNTLKTKNLINEASEREYKASVTKAKADMEFYRNQQPAGESDRMRYSGIAGQVLNPRAMYQDAKQAFQTIYDSIAKVDEQFVNIAKVADAPQKELDEFGESIYKQASKVGKAADEYGVSVARWLTTGRDLQESIKLSQTSVMGGFVGNIDEESMVRYMSVPLENYKNSALEATDIINAMNEVANNNAVEMNDLGEAYARSAQTASSAGTTFAQLTGIIAGANTTTRAGGEKIGTAIKAIDLNVSNIGAKLTKGNETKYNWLADHGIALKDTNGQLKTTYQVLSDLQKVWNNLSANDKGTATFYLAGKHHAPILQGIVKGWSTVQKATKEAEGQLNLVDKESGSAFEEFRKQQNSVQFATAQLTNAWGEFLNKVAGGKNGVVEVLGVLQKLLETATKLAENKGVRTLAKTIAELATITATTIALERGIGSGKAVVGDARLALTNFGKFFKRNKRGNISSDAISVASSKIEQAGEIALLSSGNTAKIGAGTKITSKLASAGSRTVKVFSGLGKVIGGVGAVIGGLVPVIGTVIAILTLLDATGLPVFETLGKGISKVGEMFKSSAKKAKEANNDFIKEQEKIGREIDKNKLLSGGVEQIDDLIHSYQSLSAEKEKAFKESGVKPAFTEEEFSAIKKQFNELAEKNGFDIKLTLNDYDEIKSKFEKLITLKNQLTADELEKANNKFANKLEKPKDLSEDKKAFKDDNKEAKNALEWSVKDLKKKINADEFLLKMPFVDKKKIKKEMAELVEEKEKLEKELNKISNTPFSESKYAKDADKADVKRFQNITNMQAKIAEQAKAGTLSVGFNAQTEANQKRDLAMIVNQYNKDKQEVLKINRIKEDILRANKEAENGNQNASVNKETLQYIQSLGKEYKNLNGYVRDSNGKFGKALDSLNVNIKDTTESNSKLKDSLRELGHIAGLTDQDLEGMFKAMESSGADFARYMLDTFGDAGGALLNISSTFQEQFGDNWKNAFVDIQKQIDDLKPEDKEFLIKYKIVNEDGTLNSQNYMQVYGLPEEIKTKFKLVDESTGELNLNNVSKLLGELNKDANQDIIKRLKIQTDGGDVTIESLLKSWDKLSEKDRKELVASLKINVEGEDKAENAKKAVDGVPNEKHTNLTAGGDTKNKANEAKQAVDGVPSNKDTTLNGNGNTQQKAEDARKALTGIPDRIDSTLNASGNTEDKAISARNELSKIPSSKTTTLSADISGIISAVQSALGWLGKITGIGGGAGGKSGKKNKSVAIDFEEYREPLTLNRNVSRAYSTSISNTIKNNTQEPTQNALVNSSSSTSRRNPRYYGSSSSSSKDKEATVDEAIWRYWAKELFKGLPLERRMQDLEDAIKQADDNVDKLANLYDQQRPLIEKQIEYQKSLKDAKQSELNEVLAELRKAGFKTDGNMITNLDYAKGLRGDQASNASTLLNKWKSLYEELDTLVGKISSLNSDKFELEKKIKENDIKIENEHLTKRAKIIEAYLKKISNHTDLITQKIDFVSDKDTDLKIQTLSEGIGELQNNVKDLIAEFNAIAVQTTAHAENGDVMVDNLENIKSQILDNIDAMIKWQEKIDDLRIDGLVNDFNRFNNVINKNSGFLDNNIQNLKEGLLNGTKYSDLQSSQLVDLTYSYRDQLQKQYQQRLEIEKALDEALEDFAERNIERTKNVANGALTIEKQKYEQLLNMKKQFEAGVAPSFQEIEYEYKRLDEYVDKFNNKYVPDSYKAWRNQMANVNAQYVRRLEALRSRYDAMLDGARTEEEKSLVTQRLITEQLGIQRDIQGSLIEVTKQAIRNAQAELRNSNLTSEQQEKLIDAIEEYRQTMVDAQNKIKETIKAKYELEFDYLDKLADKASRYSSVMDNLASIAEKLNMEPDDKTGILQSVFDSKVNEFVTAKASLEKLLNEQNQMEVGSYEWNILEDKIKDLKDSTQTFTLDMLEANKNMLTNELDAVEDTLSRSLLNGMSYDEWDEHIDLWISGVEKELRLEEIRKRLIENENDTIRKRLEALDMQKEISKKDLEYLDKQSKLLELENKMLGIKDERNVQTLVRNENGDWNYEYVFDQSDFDKAKEDYDKARQELEEYRTKQRGEYVKSLQDIINKAKDGGYRTPSELSNALENLNKVYRGVLSDIPDFNMDNGSEEILAIYKDYLEKNKSIIEDSVNDKKGKFTTSDLDMWGETFKNSFIGISEKLGEVVGNAVRRALSNANAIDNKNISSSYVIQKQELSFPSVTDTNGFEQVLKDLPRIATQKLTNK